MHSAQSNDWICLQFICQIQFISVKLMLPFIQFGIGLYFALITNASQINNPIHSALWEWDWCVCVPYGSNICIGMLSWISCNKSSVLLVVSLCISWYCNWLIHQIYFFMPFIVSKKNRIHDRWWDSCYACHLALRSKSNRDKDDNKLSEHHGSLATNVPINLWFYMLNWL